MKDGQIFNDEKALIEDSKEPQQSLVIEQTQVRSNGELKQSTPESKNSMPLQKVENVAREMKETVVGLEFNAPLQMLKLLPESSNTVLKEFPIELHSVD